MNTVNGRKRADSKLSPSINGSITSSSYTAHSLDQHQNSVYKNLDHPQFQIREVQLQFELKHDLRKVLVANSFMFLIAGSILYKIDLNNPSQLIKYQIPQLTTQTKTLTINAWIDADAKQLLLRIDNQYYYLHEDYSSFKPLSKMKNVDVTHAAFTSTRSIVMASPTGQIFLGVFKPHLDTKKNDLQHFKQVYNLSSQVQGIAITDNESQINIFSDFTLHTWPCFDTTYNELLGVFKSSKPVTKHISHTKENVLFAQNLERYVFLTKDELMTNDDEIQFTRIDQDLQSLLISKHHLIGYNDKGVCIINKLSQKTLALPFDGSIKGMASDRDTFWIYTDDSIHEILIHNEGNLVWYDYYKLGKYDEALAGLENNEENFYKRDLVLIKQGYDYLQKGGFGVETNDEELLKLQTRGVAILAKLTEPFEKVCLMLNNPTSKRILLEYLLAQFALEKRDKVRAIVLSTWIIELMVRLNDNRFHEFVKQNFKTFDKSIYDVLDGERALFYADLIEDYNFILQYYIDHKNWPLAVRTLPKLYLKDVDAIYNTALVLLLNYPKVTETWLRFDLDYERLLPAMLAYCTKHDHKQLPFNQNKIIKFLSKVHEQGYKSIKINNYYLSMLILSLEDTVIEITKFIKNEKLYDQNFILRLCILYKRIEPTILIYIDMGLYEQALDYALQNNAIDGAETVLNKYEDVVKEEQEEQQQQQQQQQQQNQKGVIGGMQDVSRYNKLENESYNIRRHLWLKFSKHLIDGVCQQKREVKIQEIDKSSNKISATLDYLLGKSPLGLKDLLPLFPETILINNFKDEIVSSLNEYKQSLQGINLKIQESSTLLSTLKLEAQKEEETQADSYVVVEPGAACKLCSKLLITKNFVVFKNCKHDFHKECLIRYYSKSKGNYKFKKVYQNFIRNGEKNQELLKQEIEDMLCKECILCSDANINTIDVGFLEENDRDIEGMKLWEL